MSSLCENKKWNLTSSYMGDLAFSNVNEKQMNSFEQLFQKLHDLENDREILKLRMATIECDYESQIKDLQSEIISMRVDIQKEKNVCKQLQKEKLQMNQEESKLILRLKAADEIEYELKTQLKSVKSEFIQRTSMMQEHLNSIESMRQEICQLRNDKEHLESVIHDVFEERDKLIQTLSDSDYQLKLLSKINEEQSDKIKAHDMEIGQLQETADILQHRLQNLSMNSSDNLNSAKPRFQDKSKSYQPHMSLMAELAEQRMNLLTAQDVQLNYMLDEDLENDESEMDDDAFLVYLSYTDSENSLNQPPQLDSIASDQSKTTSPDSSFVKDLCHEIAEIYQQFYRMCVELQALSGVNSNKIDDNIGTYTPDELRMVEMDFRLGSLRSVLTDLRGLLDDLKINIPQSVNKSEKYQTCNGEQNPDSLNQMIINSEISESECQTLVKDLFTTQQELMKLKRKFENYDKKCASESD